MKRLPSQALAKTGPLSLSRNGPLLERDLGRVLCWWGAPGAWAAVRS